MIGVVVVLVLLFMLVFLFGDWCRCCFGVVVCAVLFVAICVVVVGIFAVLVMVLLFYLLSW